MQLDSIIQGSALEVLRTLPSDSIDCCVTSPPYWGLRDYGTATWEGGDPECNHFKNFLSSSKSTLHDKPEVKKMETGIPFAGDCGKCSAVRKDLQLGLEPDFRDYIKNLCDIFDEVKRVLKPEGTCWVNLGDTYGADKSLVQIPSRFASEMTDRGWILRNEIVWHKPNVMPSSVKDRFTVDFEKLFFFTKSKTYHFQQQFEDAVTDINTKARGGFGSLSGKNNTPDRAKSNQPGKSWTYTDRRNKRAVWTISTKPFKEAHFATFPQELVETPIKAGCPAFGVVLDPFMGSGTTGLVAQNLVRHYLGIELNPEYIEIARRRLNQPTLDLAS